MTKRETLLVAGSVIVLIIVVAIIALRHPSLPASTSTTTEEPQEPTIPVGAYTPTRAPAPNVAVPGEGATNLASGVAAPKLVTDAAPNVPYSYRSFAITVQNGTFTPDTVIVNQKDTVDLKITSVDKTYDFYQPDYGLSSILTKGVTKTIQFGAVQSGKLTFYCQSCGGPATGPVGYVIVVPAK